MTTRRTFPPDVQELIDADVAEAEAGYSLDQLRATAVPVGHPLVVGATRAMTVPVRLDPARIAALDRMAGQEQTTRSAVIRRAIDRELAITV